MEIVEDKERLRKIIVKLTKEELIEFIKEFTVSVQKIDLSKYSDCNAFLTIRNGASEPKDFATFKMILSGESDDTKRN